MVYFFFRDTDETERYRSELIEVRAELEPWENQLIDHKGKLDVACAERRLLKEKVGVALLLVMECLWNLQKNKDWEHTVIVITLTNLIISLKTF